MPIEFVPIDRATKTRTTVRSRHPVDDRDARGDARYLLDAQRLVVLEPAGRRRGKPEVQTKLDPPAGRERSYIELRAVRLRDCAKRQSVRNARPAYFEPKAMHGP